MASSAAIKAASALTELLDAVAIFRFFPFLPSLPAQLFFPFLPVFHFLSFFEVFLCLLRLAFATTSFAFSDITLRAFTEIQDNLLEGYSHRYIYVFVLICNLACLILFYPN